jgi:uncharacterized membrane protein YdfJ with MMPL/SSD domain
VCLAASNVDLATRCRQASLAVPQCGRRRSRLRDVRLRAVTHATGARLLVGGATATGIDFANVLGHKLALFIAVVIVLAGLPLVPVFRLLAIPLQAAAMNLLSVAASLGVAVTVFQFWLARQPLQRTRRADRGIHPGDPCSATSAS